MIIRSAIITIAGVLASIAAVPAAAQEAGDSFVKVAASRTKLVDKGEVRTNGVLDPAAAYKTREARHGTVTVGQFIMDRVALQASITTPLTTNNIPAGSLAGLPNLGDDEFVLLTVGGSFHPFKGAGVAVCRRRAAGPDHDSGARWARQRLEYSERARPLCSGGG